MKYILNVYDSENCWAVITDYPTERIGHLYTFNPMPAIVLKDAYDEADIHYFKPKAKCPIPAGTKIMVGTWWQNFYGSYFRVQYEGQDYDISPRNIKINYSNDTGRQTTTTERH